VSLPAPRPALARSLEWLWRGQALLAAGTAGPPVSTTLLARQRDRAQAAYDAAVRLTHASPGGADRGPADDAQCTAPLALSLYREAAYWALCAAAGGQETPSLAQAFARLPAEVSALLFGPPDPTSVASPRGRFDLTVIGELLARDVVASAALDAEACARDTRLARDFVETLLRHLNAREDRELSLLRERVRRVAGVSALLLVGLIALVMVPRALRPDLAENAPWRVSSTTPDHAASGNGGRPIQALAETPQPNVAGETTLFFHTESEDSPWIEFDLGKVRALHSVRLVNRADCCWDRAAPLAIELSADQSHFREVARRDELFYDWSTSLGGAQARYLRVRALRPTFLHLTRVEIH
jgi:hypothetical protein